jgi:hypothetical protein
LRGGFAVDFAATRQCICREACPETATDQYNTGLNPGRPTGECVLCVDARAGVTGKLRTRSAARCSENCMLRNCSLAANARLGEWRKRAFVATALSAEPHMLRNGLRCSTPCQSGRLGKAEQMVPTSKTTGEECEQSDQRSSGFTSFFGTCFLWVPVSLFCARGPAVTNGDGPNGREYNN